MMDKSRQIRLLRQAAMLFAFSRTSNESKFSHWKRIVLFAHNHGYLYCGFDGNDIDIAAIAYRVPYVKPDHGDTMPDTESGNILYGCALASKSKDRLKLFRLIRWYFRENTDVTQFIYHYRNSNDFKIHFLRSRHGQNIKT